MRHVYLVEDGGGNPTVFGTKRRARQHIMQLGEYVQIIEFQSQNPNVEFWDNPKDLDDQQTIYRVPVR